MDKRTTEKMTQLTKDKRTKGQKYKRKTYFTANILFNTRQGGDKNKQKIARE